MFKTAFCGALLLALTSSAFAMGKLVLPSSDQIQQDAKTAAAVAQVFACDISTVANIALVAEQAANSGGQVVRTGTTTKVVNVSAQLCGTLGGVASAIPASAVAAH